MQIFLMRRKQLGIYFLVVAVKESISFWFNCTFNKIKCSHSDEILLIEHHLAVVVELPEVAGGE